MKVAGEGDDAWWRGVGKVSGLADEREETVDEQEVTENIRLLRKVSEYGRCGWRGNVPRRFARCRRRRDRKH